MTRPNAAFPTAKAYRQKLERFRLALQLARGLAAAEFRVALLMLEMSNRQIFDERGTLESWLSEDTIHRCTGLSARAVRQARRNLVDRGVIAVSARGGHGPGHTTRYGFRDNWLSTVEREMAEAGTIDLIRGRGNATAPLNDGRGNGEAAKGEILGQLRGNHSSPDSCELTPMNYSRDSTANAVPTENQNLLSRKERRMPPLFPSELARIEKLNRMLADYERRGDTASATSTRRQIDEILFGHQAGSGDAA